MFNRSVNHAICSELLSFKNLTKFIFIEEIEITGLELLIIIVEYRLCISLRKP